MSLYGTSDSEDSLDSLGDDMEMTSNAVPPNSQVDRECEVQQQPIKNQPTSAPSAVPGDSSNAVPPNSQVDGECEVQQQPIKNQPTSAPSAVPDGWMPIPRSLGGAQLPHNIPDGLKCLLVVDQIKVQQKMHLKETITLSKQNNKYAVLNKDGQKMFYAVEDTDSDTRNCYGSLREFEMKISDNQGREIIHLSRPLACNSCLCPSSRQKIEVYSPPGNLVGIVEQDWSFLTSVFTIRNALHEEVLKIKGPICRFGMCGSDVEFKILSRDQTSQVGRISKEWSGLAKEILTDAANFSISFPMDLDVQMKTVMIGACFLIDYMYFEKLNYGILKQLISIT